MSNREDALDRISKETRDALESTPLMSVDQQARFLDTMFDSSFRNGGVGPGLFEALTQSNVSPESWRATMNHNEDFREKYESRIKLRQEALNHALLEKAMEMAGSEDGRDVRTAMEIASKVGNLFPKSKEPKRQELEYREPRKGLIENLEQEDEN